MAHVNLSMICLWKTGDFIDASHSMLSFLECYNWNESPTWHVCSFWGWLIRYTIYHNIKHHYSIYIYIYCNEVSQNSSWCFPDHRGRIERFVGQKLCVSPQGPPIYIYIEREREVASLGKPDNQYPLGLIPTWLVTGIAFLGQTPA